MNSNKREVNAPPNNINYNLPGYGDAIFHDAVSYQKELFPLEEIVPKVTYVDYINHRLEKCSLSEISRIAELTDQDSKVVLLRDTSIRTKVIKAFATDWRAFTLNWNKDKS